jgi:EmrB/QacA subfamily drug resistance transporter
MIAAPRATRCITLVVTCLGFFMVLLDSTIVIVALPTIQFSLHARLSDMQWAIDAYTLPYAAFMLTTGTLGDRFGRKRLFLVGLVLFLLGSTLCGLAPTLGWFIFGRVVQGTGAAALSPGSLSLLVAAFPEPRMRSQAIGIWSGISGVALAAGPLLGGLLIGIASWPAIFFVNLPIGLVALALGWPGLSESRNPTARQIDLPGQLLAIAGLTCLITALIESTWTSPLILGLFLGSVVCFSAFLLVEARTREPLFPLHLFVNRVFSIANVASLTLGFSILGTVFFVTQYFQEVQGYTAFESGLRTLPITMCSFLVAPFSGMLAARLGTRLPIILGILLASSALFLLIRLEPDSAYTTLWWSLSMLGIGYGFMLSPLTATALSATPPTRVGLGSSMITTSRLVGVTLGIAVLGAVVLQQFSGNIMSQLRQLGAPGPISATIANKIAASGAQASQVHLTGQLPLPEAELHQAINQAFVDALHGAFLLSGMALLVVALLVALTFKQHGTSKRIEAAASQEMTPAQEALQGSLQGDTEN